MWKLKKRPESRRRNIRVWKEGWEEGGRGKGGETVDMLPACMEMSHETH
jgi:hypothetical protein